MPVSYTHLAPITQKAQPAGPAKQAAPAPAPQEKPTAPRLNQAITQCEAILATEAVSIRSQATIAGAMRAVALKINLGTIDSVASFNDLFMQIVHFTLQLQKRVAELGNTQSVAGGDVYKRQIPFRSRISRLIFFGSGHSSPWK